MANPKTQEVPFLIDGNLIVKSITKNTTCRDVIAKLPNLPVRLAVFESVEGQEKELSGKTKLLKIWRAHGPSKKVVFVVRKSQFDGDKSEGKRRVFGDKRKCDQPTVKSAHTTTRDRLKQVSDLAFYVRYQKKKLSNLSKKNRDKTEKTESEPARLMKRFMSTASRDSMDSFLATTDLEKMAEFLGFCSNVTNEELDKSTRNRSVDADKTIVNNCSERRQMLTPVRSKSNIVEESLRRAKLGLKTQFVAKNNQEKKSEQRTSTGTLSSTDSGYSSVGTAPSASLLAKKHTFLDLPTDDMPRHSTPVSAATVVRRKRTAVVLDNTFNSEQFDETKGKDMILQKFMADQTVTTGEPDVKKPRTDNTPMFTSQSEKCKYLWDKYCDSDDESSVCDSEIFENDTPLDSSALDHAFLDSVTDDTDDSFPEKKTLRRESAISDLNRILFFNNQIEQDYFNEDGGFDYSFNCTFQRFDGSQSLDQSYSFDESDCEDDYMDSFMKTRRESELLRDVNFKLTGYESGSDEGLGSLSGASVSDSGPEMVI